MTVRRLFLTPAWLFFSLPCYLGWRLLSASSLRPVGIAAGIALLIAACVIIPYSVRTRGMRDRVMADRVAWIGLTLMGFFSSLFVLTVLRDIVLGALYAITDARYARAWIGPSAAGVICLAIAITILGLIAARRPPRVVNVQIPVAGLPESLRGFSIAQISDVHVGPTIKKGFVERIVQTVNRLHPDMIALTGDLVDGSVRELSGHTAPLAALRAMHGAFFVPGNHEYYSGETAWSAEIERLGIHVLKNAHIVLQHGAASVIVAGVTDYSAHHFDPSQKSDPVRALQGAPQGAGAKILLAHQPSSAAAASEAGFDVQLSGHTHGGQFWPWNMLIRYFQPFTAGLHRLKNLQVYVSSGTGYWGPPNRFGVSSEITHIRLVPA